MAASNIASADAFSIAIFLFSAMMDPVPSALCDQRSPGTVLVMFGKYPKSRCGCTGSSVAGAAISYAPQCTLHGIGRDDFLIYSETKDVTSTWFTGEKDSREMRVKGGTMSRS
jgi:hypothetical protein